LLFFIYYIVLLLIKTNKMGKLGQKIEHIDNATNEIMDKIRDIFNEIDLIHYINNNTDYDIDDLDDKIYSIIHNKLKEII